jgi:hypothetical protein
MGLNEGDQDNVPPELIARDCYERIWAWHRTSGEDEAQKQGLAPDHMEKYLAILVELPPDSDATFEDMDFLFREVLNGTFEWSYHQEDSHGIKMAAYAFHAIDKQHQGDMAALEDSAANSTLTRLKG